jgi:hypothetical protein
MMDSLQRIRGFSGCPAFASGASARAAPEFVIDLNRAGLKRRVIGLADGLPQLLLDQPGSGITQAKTAPERYGRKAGHWKPSVQRICNNTSRHW